MHTTHRMLFVAMFCMATASTAVQGQDVAAAVKAANDKVTAAGKASHEAKEKLAVAEKLLTPLKSGHKTDARASKEATGHAERARQLSVNAAGILEDAETKATRSYGDVLARQTEFDAAKVAYDAAKGTAGE